MILNGGKKAGIIMSKTIRRLGCLWMAAVLLCGCAKKPSAETKTHDSTTDLIRTSERESITWDLIEMVNHNAELKQLLESPELTSFGSSI